MSTILGNSLFLDMLAHHELAMKKLYSLYVAKFPGQAEFWQKLASEENGHAEMIIKLRDGFQKGAVSLPETRFKVGDIKMSLDTLNKKISTWEKWDVSREDAFEYAIQQEDHLVEDVFSLPMDIEIPDLDLLFQQMALACREHRELLEKNYSKSNRSVFNLFGLLGK